MLSEQMESRCLAMLVLVLGFLMLGGGEGCLEEERLALSRLKPFFPFIDSTFGGSDFFSYFGEEDYDSVEEKESSIDCCKWERVECNPTTGRLTHLFLNVTETYRYEYDLVFDGYSKKRLYLNASLFLPFQELQYLSLSGNLIAGCVVDQGFERLSSKLNKLEILDLSSNYFNDSILTSISELSSLKSLSLKDNWYLTLLNPTNGIKMLSKLNNLETLNLSSNNLGNNILSQLYDFTSLKSLNLQGCGLEGTINLLELNTLTNLKELYLDYNGIEGIESSIQEKGEMRLNKLEVLGLAHNQFTNTIFSSLVALPNLKFLDLSWNKLKGAIDVKELRLMNLKVLNLLGNPLDNSILATFGRLSNLKTLSFEVTELNRSIDITEMYGLKNLEMLEMYCYSDMGCNISLQSLNLFSSVKILHLEGFNIKETRIHSHSQNKMDGLKNLEELTMNCYSDKDCNISLQSLNLFSSLKTLYLDGFNIKETRVHSRSQNKWQNLTNLEELVLRDSSLPFNFIGTLPSLKQLDMQDCYLDDSLFKRDTLNLKNLETLRVYGTFLGNNFFKRIGAMPSLKILSLTDYGLNDTRIRWFEALSSLSLEKLDISCFSRGCSLPLRSFGLFPSLKTLSLGGFSFNETTAASNFQNKWQNLTNLEELVLWDSSLPFNFIGTLPSLKQLYMQDCYLDDSLFMQELDGLSGLNSLSLEKLYVNCYLRDEHSSFGNNFLQKLGAMPSLKFLRLSNCGQNDTLQYRGFCSLTNLRALDMSNNHLMGKLPECISNFTSLESLDLSSNHFSGDVSVFESLTSLKELRLSDNYFHIPSSLGPFFNLSELTHFYADNNTLYVESQMQALVPTFQLNAISLSCCGDAGQLPQFLYHQRNLQFVRFSNLNLRGDFPNWLLQNNTNLQSLNLANNSLLGSFELSFLPHTGLSSLDISQNFFHGKLPTEIGAKLPSLSYLNMSNNHFHGSIPASIGDLKFLEYLDLSDNLLSGGLPEHLIMGCSSLSSLILSNNRLQGQMFSSKFNLTNLWKLHLDGNHFSGKIPDSLSNCSWLSTLDVSNNELVGGIPRWMENMSSLSTLDLSNNEISGNIPKWMGSMSSLEELVMARNHLEGPFPEEFCLLNLHLKLLDLSVNNISGHIPSCFSPLWISQVQLSRNKLQGPLTNAFRYSNALVTLDLSHNHLTGNIPNWIGNLSQMSYLLLNNNHFEGMIPLQLCNLGHLSLIDLSNNNLSGMIPSCLKITTWNEGSQEYVRYLADVGNFNSSFSIDEPIEFTSKNNSYSYKGRILTYLSGIDLSCNKLTGEIPREVNNFRNIYALNLSHNSLIGPIPLAFSDLKQIESLDLSHNNLSGTIPPQLVGLYSLSYFSVAYNNLSGSTPAMTAQFSTFEEISYVGNPLLCGKPLPKNCSTSGPSPSSLPKGSTDKGFLDMTAFYASFAASYVVVILSIASVLYINPYWRQAWFYHIGEINKRCQYFLEDHILPKRFHCGN